MVKACSQCGLTKLFGDFYKSTSGKFGLHGACKECHKARVRARAAADLEGHNARKRARRAARPEQAREASRAWHAANPERARELRRAYYAANRDTLVAYRREYYAANRERVIAGNTAWVASNPERVGVYYHRHRATRAQRRFDWDNELSDLVEAEAQDVRLRRQTATGVEWQVDHVIPLKAKLVSGLHVWNNLAVVPAQFNLSKKNRWVGEPECAWGWLRC